MDLNKVKGVCLSSVLWGERGPGHLWSQPGLGKDSGWELGHLINHTKIITRIIRLNQLLLSLWSSNTLLKRRQVSAVISNDQNWLLPWMSGCIHYHYHLTTWVLQHFQLQARQRWITPELVTRRPAEPMLNSASCSASSYLARAVTDRSKVHILQDGLPPRCRGRWAAAAPARCPWDFSCRPW